MKSFIQFSMLTAAILTASPAAFSAPAQPTPSQSQAAMSEQDFQIFNQVLQETTGKFISENLKDQSAEAVFNEVQSIMQNMSFGQRFQAVQNVIAAIDQAQKDGGTYGQWISIFIIGEILCFGASAAGIKMKNGLMAIVGVIGMTGVLAYSAGGATKTHDIEKRAIDLKQRLLVVQQSMFKAFMNAKAVGELK